MPLQAGRRSRFVLALAALAVFCAQISAAAERRPKVCVGGKTFFVSVVDTPEARTRGLSGSEPLAEDEGMLFIFDRDGRYPIWMKEMRFSLDIIWINRFGKIVHVEREVHPDTYPRAFASNQPARYVLEIPAKAGETAVPGGKVYFRNVLASGGNDERPCPPAG